MATTSAGMACSICDASTILPEKRLYGSYVCSTCHSSFAMRRAFAHILDVVLFTVVTVPFTFVVLLFSGISGGIVGAATNSDNRGANVALMVFFLCMLGFVFLFLAKDGFAGHSPAKAMLGLQVIDDLTGRPANFWDSFQRNLPTQIPFMHWYVLYQLLQYDGRRIGDGWSRTKVIWKPYRDKAPFLSRKQLQARLAAKAAGLPK
jgi:uncharacterized RDD family membrane protein YckC